MRILGIDPGTATTGYGIIEANFSKDSLRSVKFGAIKTSASSTPQERLYRIYKELNKLKKYKPEVLAIEKLYFFKNKKTAIAVSQAKGVILFWAGRNKIPVYEFTPLEVKMGIIGYGRAKKIQIQRMVKHLLKLEELPKPDDVADALAIAICCFYYLKNSCKRCEKRS